MIFHTHTKKSKPKTIPKAQRYQYETWLRQVNSPVEKFSRGISKPIKTTVIPPYRRESMTQSSLGDGIGSATKPIQTQVYTGTNMIGIGTLHKSNAVPVFNSMDAVNIANMRR